ncbi:MAG: choice-of-anchor tandem repeat GloVer-containing protein, partial [Bacteroidota bacterium]
MKKTIIFALCLGFLTSAFSQGELWGVSESGGLDGVGCIFKTDVDGSNASLVYSFESKAPGKRPEELNLYEYNGLLYGVTSGGGLTGDGVLFSYDPNTQIYTALTSFIDSIVGTDPDYSVVVTSDDKVYGTTDFRGPLEFYGVLYSFDLNTQAFEVLVAFDSTTVNGSEKALTLGSDGHLYGTAGDGGANGDGLIFKYDLGTNAYSVLYDFSDDILADGDTPDDALLEVSPGLFYGTTDRGGLNSDGVLFSFDVNTGTYTKLFDFDDNISGEFPQGTLLLGSNQKIYGSTREGGTFNDGAIFEYDPATSIFTLLHSFTNSSDGENPYGLREAGNGVLYGLAKNGGAEGDGTLFEY